MKTLIQVTIILIVVLGNSVLAHAGLTFSSPKNNEHLIKQPEELVLEFSKPVRLLKVELFDQSGESITLNFKIAAKPSQRYTVSLNEIKQGHYTVKWIALGGDAHKMSGEFTFSFQPANEASTTQLDKKRTLTLAGHRP